MSSESHKMSQKPLDEMTPEELKKFVDSIDPDAMGFDGHEVPEDV